MSPSPHSTSEKFPATLLAGGTAAALDNSTLEEFLGPLLAVGIAAALDNSHRDEDTVNEYLRCMLADMEVLMEKVQGCVFSEKESAEQMNVRMRIICRRTSKSGWEME